MYILVCWHQQLVVSRETADDGNVTYVVPYSGKLSREKTFANLTALEPPMKIFSTKFGPAIRTYD